MSISLSFPSALYVYLLKLIQEIDGTTSGSEFICPYVYLLKLIQEIVGTTSGSEFKIGTRITTV